MDAPVRVWAEKCFGPYRNVKSSGRQANDNQKDLDSFGYLSRVR